MVASGHVRYWHKADIPLVALHMSAFGGKADMTTWPIGYAVMASLATIN